MTADLPAGREPDTCKGVVYEPEAMRRGRMKNGRMGFARHYVRRACKRILGADNAEKYCWQHYDQGEYERELEHAYAAHAAVY